MEKNCLVTKLKGVINNPSLSKLGTIIVHPNSNVTIFRTAATEATTIVFSGLQFNSGGTPVQSPIIFSGSRSYQVTNVTPDAVIEIYPKYYLTTLDLANYREEDLEFTFDDIKCLSALQTLFMNASSIQWSLDAILTTFLGLSEFSCTNSAVYGDWPTTLNKVAKLRPGTSIVGVIANPAHITNTPVGMGTTWQTACTIYFSSNTTKYPNGWYILASDGTYYDSEGNVTTGE